MRSPTFETRSTIRTERGNRRELTNTEKTTSARLRRIWNQKARTLGLTQAKATKQFNVSQPLIAQYLSGYLVLNERFTLKFAKLLDVDPCEINPEFKEFSSILSNTTLLTIETNIYAPRLQKGDLIAVEDTDPQPNDLIFMELNDGFRIGVLEKQTPKQIILRNPNNMNTNAYTKVTRMKKIKAIICS